MTEFFLNLNSLLNEPQSIKVLSVLVLLLSLLWITTGFSFLDKDDY